METLASTEARPPPARADAVARRVLRVPERREAVPATNAERAFSTSMLVSGTRCLLTYVVLPFVAPAPGFAARVGPAIGLVIGVVAIACNVVTVRRFWLAEHRRRWAYTAIAAAVVALLVVLLVADVAALVG